MPTYLTVSIAFAVLAVAPLALVVLSTPGSGAPVPHSIPMAWACVALGAIALSLVIPVGIAAALLTVPWLVLAALLALRHLRAVVASQEAAESRVPAVLALVALGFLVVGASSLLITRSGLRPLNLDPLIIGLTAVHFHVAGLGGMTLATRTQGRVRNPRAKTVAAVAGFTAAAGIGIVALGFTGPQLGLGATVALQAVGGSITGIGFITIVFLETFATRPDGVSRALFGVGAVALPAGMVLAVSYSMGAWLHTPALSIDAMARTHGVLNGVGFVLCGLVAWNRMQPELEEGSNT